MHQPGHGDADHVQRHHGGGKDAHIQNIGGGRNDGRDDEDDQNGIAQVAPHEPGADDAHQGEEEHQDGQFKDGAQPDDDGQEQVSVLADGNHGLELAAVADQEVQRLGVNNLVAKVSAGQKKEDGGGHERQHVALFVAVEAGGDEHPQLVENEGRGNKQTGQEPNLQVHVEGLGGVQVDQLLRHVVALQGFHDGPLHEAENAVGIVEAGEEGDAHSGDGVDD